VSHVALLGLIYRDGLAVLAVCRGPRGRPPPVRRNTRIKINQNQTKVSQAEKVRSTDNQITRDWLHVSRLKLSRLGF
jgi:hypothetical protein